MKLQGADFWHKVKIYCIYFNPTQELQLNVLTMTIIGQGENDDDDDILDV